MRVVARVLVVEDHELLNRYLCDAIRARGHDVDCTKTQDEAVRLLETRHYDVIVCDLILPDGTGHEVSKVAEDRGIKTLRITGHPDEFAKVRDAGVPCLYKPFSSHQLYDAIDALLETA